MFWMVNDGGKNCMRSVVIGKISFVYIGVIVYN